jgi:hypothetical protein
MPGGLRMPTTPGRFAVFDHAGNVTDSIVVEAAPGFIGIGTANPNAVLEIRVQNEGDWALKLQSGENDFLDVRPNQVGGRFQTELNTINDRDVIILPGTGRVGIKTSSPASELHVSGYLTLDPGSSPVLFTGTGGAELDRYLLLINSPDATTASGLKAGGVLVSDSYDYADPGKNDLVVKGNITVGGGVIAGGQVTATSATIGGDMPANNARVVIDQDLNGANLFISSRGRNAIVQLSSVPGFPDNGAVLVTDLANSIFPIIARAGMFVDANGLGTVIADIKNFRVVHPGQPDMEIVYACIEGPEAAVYVRGTGRLVDGEAVIPLPEHFTSVANPVGMTVQVTPHSADSLGLAIVAKRKSRIEVKELHRGTGNYDFDWEVKSVRIGYEDYRVIRPRSEMSM